MKKGKRRTPEDAFQQHYCPSCPRYYTNDSSLKRHLKLKHLDIGDDPPTTSLISPSPAEKGEGKEGGE